MHECFPNLLVKAMLDPDACDAAAESGNKLVQYRDILMQDINSFLRVEVRFSESMAIRCGFQLDLRNLPTLFDIGDIAASRTGFQAVQVRGRLNLITAEQYPELYGLFKADMQNIQRIPSFISGGGSKDRQEKKVNLFKALNINASRVYVLFQKFSTDSKYDLDLVGKSDLDIISKQTSHVEKSYLDYGGETGADSSFTITDADGSAIDCVATDLIEKWQKSISVRKTQFDLEV